MVYEQRVRDLEAKTAATGKRLRAMWDEEAQRKQSRCIQVCSVLSIDVEEPLPCARTDWVAWLVEAQVIQPLQRSRRGGSSKAAPPPKPADQSRHRLLKKLGLPGQQARPVRPVSHPAKPLALPRRSALTAPPSTKPAPAPRAKPAASLLEEVDIFKR